MYCWGLCSGQSLGFMAHSERKWLLRKSRDNTAWWGGGSISRAGRNHKDHGDQPLAPHRPSRTPRAGAVLEKEAPREPLPAPVIKCIFYLLNCFPLKSSGVWPAASTILPLLTTLQQSPGLQAAFAACLLADKLLALHTTWKTPYTQLSKPLSMSPSRGSSITWPCRIHCPPIPSGERAGESSADSLLPVPMSAGHLGGLSPSITCPGAAGTRQACSEPQHEVTAISRPGFCFTPVGV